MTKANVGRGALPVKTLCQAAVEKSDNTAAILLMRSVGGPASLTQFLRGLGDTVTRSDRYEPESNKYNGVLDTTTPRAIATVARSILLGDVLNPQSRAHLESWMTACTPGLNRLRAAFPADWQAADRPERAWKKRPTTMHSCARPAAPRCLSPRITTRRA